MIVMSTFFSRIRYVLIPLENGFEMVNEAHPETGTSGSPGKSLQCAAAQAGAFWA